MTNKGKLLTKLNLWYDGVLKSLTWLVNVNLSLEMVKCLNIFLSQCRNIVCKNIYCV